MPSKSIAESVLPGLNPYHPNQRRRPPLAAMVKSCGIIGPPPSRLNFRPRRGPRTIAPAKAMKPPMVCTTVEHESKAEGEEEQSAKAGIDDAFHQDIYGLA